jgi:ureidoglycolate dehydrogenase (NAD+)
VSKSSPDHDPAVVSADTLSEFMSHLLRRLGASAPHAAIVAGAMVEADLRDVHTHGCAIFPFLMNLKKAGFINVDPEIKLSSVTDNSAVMDGDMGFGQVIAQSAMEMALEKATAKGLGCVTVRNMSYAGMVGLYPLIAARKGHIGIFLGSGPKIMPPLGGDRALFCTNPIAVAIPTAGEPILLDMATSVVSLGQIQQAAREGIKIPPGLGVDRNGNPTDDPNEILRGGFLNWAAGPKGYGLAIVAEVLSAVLSGGAFGAERAPLAPLGEKALLYSCFCLALDPGHFLAPGEFISNVEKLKRDIRNSHSPGWSGEILLPGERSSHFRSERLKKGIPISESLRKNLNSFSRDLGLDRSL